MQISINLGSYTRKRPCPGKTPELCWICSPNHELNHQLLDRAINCNVTGGLCARCHQQPKPPGGGGLKCILLVLNLQVCRNIVVLTVHLITPKRDVIMIEAKSAISNTLLA